MAFVFPDDVWAAAQRMPEGQREAFLLAVVEFGFTGAEPTSADPWTWAFDVVKDRITMSTKAHEKGKAMAAARYAKQPAAAASTSSVHEHPAAAACLVEKRESGEEESGVEKGKAGAGVPKRERFAPPTVEEVAAFCGLSGLDVDPERFVDYYAAQGWRLSNGRTMRDWHAAARNWARRDRPKAASSDEFSVYSKGLRVVGGDEL